MALDSKSSIEHAERHGGQMPHEATFTMLYLLFVKTGHAKNDTAGDKGAQCRENFQISK